MQTIQVVDYDPLWPERFAQLRDMLLSAVADFAIAIEHVGSTAVPGLAAKPVLDIDIVASEEDIATGVQRVVALGYESLGELDIPLREAFRAPSNLARHNLYVTAEGCESHRNHLAVRDYLRAHFDAAREYGALKKRLARTADGDIDRYIAGKSGFIANILSRSGFSEQEVEGIRMRNVASST
ncbi:MAG: GrpB family protein [Candidatus Eremiobacteraeota bacterium]|nr:GrpB family protein [Candidatus Eremiobacteraeota bacterium]